MDLAYKLRVLVVDDSSAMRSLIKTVLQAQFKVSQFFEAGDADQAFASFQTSPVDLVITDIAMEPTDGITLIRNIRATSDVEKRKVPIIAVTGYSTRTMVENLRDLGVHEILTKPVTISALSERVRSVFERPRDFVEDENYVGPDRRRREDEKRLGPERRDSMILDQEIDIDESAA